MAEVLPSEIQDTQDELEAWFDLMSELWSEEQNESLSMNAATSDPSAEEESGR